LGVAVREIEQLDWPQPTRRKSRIDGAVQWIDAFGNLITNISASLLDVGADQNFAAGMENSTRRFKIECAGRVISGIVRSYGHRPTGESVALVGSSGFLEIAIVNGSAAATLGARVGTPVMVEWQS
jgi:S-adenosylmethionine hydrolase